jgi:copper resistance protein B
MNKGSLLIFVIFFLVLPAPTLAEEKNEKSYFPENFRDAPAHPPEGQEIAKYADDGQKGPATNFGRQPVHDNAAFATFKADRFEHQWREHDHEVLLWDVQGWIGNDDDKLYLKSEGEMSLDGGSRVEEAEVELLYSRNISKFWDLQLGVRQDFRPRPERTFAAIGLQGLAPYWFEIDATTYLSEDGDLSATVEAEYEVMLTQRLVVIPRVETGLSLQDVPEYEQWQGITDVTLGARLMYQISRKFAPYVGVTWNRKVGETAHEIDKEGGDISSSGLVAGIRFWF